jgi:hypothetical protein
MSNCYTFRADIDIMEKDIISLCKLLNDQPIYKEVCSFEPEPITEGGIVYKFKNDNFYKSIRFRLYQERADWPWISSNVMIEWEESNDILFREKSKNVLRFCRSSQSPKFTLEELQVWEKCLGEIGFRKIGKVPSKRYLESI